MDQKFSISLSALDKDKLPLSYKFIHYLDNFVVEEILRKKNIILNAKLNVRVCIMFQIFDNENHEDKIIDIVKPSTISSENVKQYYYVLHIKSIVNAPKPIEKLLAYICDTLSMFFLEYYKSVSSVFLKNVWAKLDIEYLLSLPYPAHRVHRRDVYSNYGH